MTLINKGGAEVTTAMSSQTGAFVFAKSLIVAGEEYVLRVKVKSPIEKYFEASFYIYVYHSDPFYASFLGKGVYRNHFIAFPCKWFQESPYGAEPHY